MWISIGLIVFALLAIGVTSVTTMGRAPALRAAAAGLRHRQQEVAAAQVAVARMAERVAVIAARSAAARERVEVAASHDGPA